MKKRFVDRLPLATATGSGIVVHRQEIDTDLNTASAPALQAAFIRRRLFVSPALLPVVTALAFGEKRT